MNLPDQTAGAPLTIRFFGPMSILVHGRPLARVRSRKGYWLLALLALRNGRRVEREWLSGTLWPDIDQDRALANLRPIVSELRAAFLDQRHRIQSPDRHTLALDLAGVDADLIDFDRGISLGTSSDLRRAVDLYRGPLLEGCDEEWVVPERRLREQACLRALLKLGDAALFEGDLDTAAGCYQRAVSIDPWNEAACRGLMEELSQAGDTNAALQVYRELVDHLRDDPLAAPDEMTTALYRALRDDAKRKAQSRPSPVKSNNEPLAGYLPNPVTELVGREQHCCGIVDRLRRARMVTLTGFGGIGKTRLALAVGAEYRESRPEEVWFIGLESLAPGSGIGGTIASVLGIKEQPSHLEAIAAFLRDRRALIILDNCEHLLESCAATAAHLLRECYGVRILATSREPLNVTGEVAWSVPNLEIPDLDLLPERSNEILSVLTDCPSVALFLDRAEAAQRTFALTPANAQLVARICSRLDGIPLAIELAAARVKAMTLPEIAARLDDELEFLTSSGRTTHPRHRTVRATLDWSHSLLNEPERALFRRLSVFRGGWTVDSAAQTCFDEAHPVRMADQLAALVDKSLVHFDPGESHTDGRYGWSEVVRQYAAEQLSEAGETEAFWAKHLAWCLRLAEESRIELDGPTASDCALRLDAEHDNLRAAIAFAMEPSSLAEFALRITSSIWRYWLLRGHISEGRALLERALAKANSDLVPEAFVRALNGCGTLAHVRGDLAGSRAFHVRAQDLAAARNDNDAVASALIGLGNVATSQGLFAEAKLHYEQSLSILRPLGRSAVMTKALMNLGMAELMLGENAHAEDLLNEALSLQREMGDENGVAGSLRILGELADARGDYAKATQSLDQSIEIYRHLNNPQGPASALTFRANVYFSLGDIEAVSAMESESIGIYRRVGNRIGVAWSLMRVAEAEILRGELDEGRRCLAESLRLFSEAEVARGAAYGLKLEGLAALKVGGYADAQAFVRRSIASQRELGDNVWIPQSLDLLAAACAAALDSERAARLWGAAAAVRAARQSSESPGDRLFGEPYLTLAREALSSQQFDAAWMSGRAMTVDQAISYALGEEPMVQFP